MRMQSDLSLRTEQRAVLAPRMLQSIEVLQLAAADLVRLIDAELQQNEALELLHPERAPEPDCAEPDSVDDPGSAPERAGQRAARGPEDAGDKKSAMLHNIPARDADLLEHVREQLAWEEFSADLRQAVLTLAEQLDGSGFLGASVGELRPLVGEEHFDRALAVLQSMEPRGLGASGPIEAMLLQLTADDPDRPAIEAILREHLQSIARNKIPEVARALELSEEELELLLQRIGELDPRPGESFRSAPDEPIRPELFVRREADRVEVVVDDVALPVLGVDETYERMADAADTEPTVREYLRDKVRSARELIVAIEHRKSTLARVGSAVLSRQPGFLERGRVGIRPLKMSDIAAELDMHTSTVSRTVAGKFIQTERGVFSLREFFDGDRRRNALEAGEHDGSAPRGTVTGDGQGRVAVQEQVRQIFATEDPSRPLSDDDVVELLRARGIAVARRTVAKYRQELGIPSSFRRRRYRADR